MKRKLLFAMVALLSIVGVQQSYAYTTGDLESAGWTKVTTALADVNNYYYVFVDADASATAMFRNNESDARPFYNTLADPKTNLEEVWVIAQNGDNYTIKGNTESFFFNSGSAGWNDYVGHNNDNGNFSFTLNEGKYSIKTTTFSGNGWVGPWNNSGHVSGTLPENIACNKEEAQAPGFFLYSILRTTFEAQLAEARTTATAGASEADPADVTSYIVNPSFTSKNAQGWTRTGSAGNQQWGQQTMESWNATNVVLKQELRGIPNGKYRVTADIISGPGATKAAYVFGTGSAKVSSSVVSAEASANNYTTMSNEVAGKTLTANNVIVTGNAITIGFDQSTGWIVADNFKLYYLGEDLSIYIDAYNDAVDAAEAVDQSAPMLATALTALQSAISTYGTGVDTSNKDALLTATTALSTATSNATASIEAYAPMAPVITEIDAVLAAATSTTVAADDYNAIKTAYTNGTIANDKIASKIIEAYDAIIPVIKSQTDTSADFTYAIRNHSFEYGNMTGWTVTASSDTGVRDTSNPTYAATGSDGKYLFNTWWKGNPITQTVSDLPNGQYTLTVSVSSDGATIYLKANGEHDGGTESGGTYPSNNTFQEASFDFLVKDGTATIGVVGGADGTAGVHKDYVEDGYWWYKADNFRLVKNRNLTVEETKTILASVITTAEGIDDKSLPNVGYGVFQIPNATEMTFYYAISDAKTVYNDGSATIGDVEQAISDLNDAIEAYAEAELNAPDPEKRYNIILKYAEYEHDGKAITYIANARADMGLYNVQYQAAPNANYAQAITFTHISGNTYKMSQTDVDGNTRYLCTGVPYGGNTSQIRTTTTAGDALVVKIIATNTKNIFNIYNTEAKNYIGSQDAGVYTVNSHIDFTLAEASQATVPVKIQANKYGTIIFPFIPDVSTGFDDVTFYTCSEKDGDDAVKIEPLVGDPKANTPYVVRNANGDAFNMNISGWGTAYKDSYDAGYLTGIYTAAEIPVGSYVLQTQSGVQGFYQVKDDPLTGVAYRAYLTVPAATAKSLKIVVPGQPTDVNAPEVVETEEPEVLFNLAGIPVGKDFKGVVINQKGEKRLQNK